ncbi:protein LYK2 [Prunus yedoensis var. nudiflora]|uniref:Protein LYK2 n=1 Tax=Prunus yedoensis var. nudiflora TaxID=2094558 RepID=A0A314URN6_PRUYE|nr:protein LYK2 [Prunus yedoensis var. nudiflora]
MAAALLTKLHLTVSLLFISLPVFAVLGHKSQNLLSCETTSPDASGYHCTSAGTNGSSLENQCRTFAILRTNSYYSSLFNLSAYLGINRFVIAEANGFSADTEFLPKDEPLLIPIDCKCSSNGGLFHAELTKTTIKGESFYGIAEALEGLTTCKAIREKNRGISPWGDTISDLAIKFNTTQEAIISENNRSLGGIFRPESSLTPLTSLLIPLNGKPTLGPLAKPREPNLRFPATSIPAISPHKKKAKMHKIGLYVALSGVIIGASIAIAAAFLLIQLKKKKQGSPKGGDVELQQLSLSVRTTSDKKVSFEGSQETLDGQIIDTTTPRKVLVETYSIEELRRATEDFSSSNHIEGSVYHGRLIGKNLAIKRTQPDTISRIEFGLFHDAIYHHPNIMRLLGTCLTEGQESFLVFEYAKNGSLKDWLHGGLAIKNQFIASCYCFLTWSQRLRICLDVAMALQYMHHVMNPSYVHRNVKSRNIFLDEEFNAKIGNFGMAKCAENDTEDHQVCSTSPSASWSLGYMAPEYIHQGVISPSIDIFAYGVVLLEVLCGQTPISRPSEKGEGNFWLSEKIKSILQSDNADELREWMDSGLGENYSFDAAVTFANLARACVDEDPCLRAKCRRNC